MDTSTLAIVLLLVLALFATFGFRKYRVDSVKKELADDPDVEATGHTFGLELRTRPPRREGTVSSAGGKNNPPRWDVWSRAQLEARTSLSLSREGIFGSIREAVGFKDIHLGDEAFDRDFTIRGSDEAAVKDLLADGTVKAAITRLFTHDVWTLRVSADGEVHCRARRRRLDSSTPKELLLEVTSLCDLLEETERASLPASRA